MRRTALVAAFCMAAACGTEPSIPPADSPEAAMRSMPTSLSNASTVCQNLNRNDPNFISRYDCNDIVLVTSTNSLLREKIVPAIGVWNAGILGRNELPVFVASGSSNRTVTVFFSQGDTGNWFCATTNWSNVTSITIEVYRSSQETNCEGGFSHVVDTSGLHRLIAHELSHAIGYKHLSESSNRRPAAEHCIASLPIDGTLNGGLCATEIEMLRYNYGLRDAFVDPAKLMASEMVISGSAPTDPGLSRTLRVEDVSWNAPASVARPELSKLGLAWSSDSAEIAQVSAGTGATNAIQAISAGTTTIRVRITSSSYQMKDPLPGSAVPFTVNGDPPPPIKPLPPSGLSASAVTATSAKIQWVNGATPGITTTVQQRRNGVTTWSNVGFSIPAGQTSATAVALRPSSTYDIRVFHMLNGISSDTTTRLALFTTPAFPAIANFRLTDCFQQAAGGKTYNYFTLAWSAAPALLGANFQIGMQTSNNPAAATVIVTKPSSAGTGDVGGYLSSPLLMNRWFWIRYYSAGATGPWTALPVNPIATNQCLQ